jgi:hypothetical protein
MKLSDSYLLGALFCYGMFLAINSLEPDPVSSWHIFWMSLIWPISLGAYIGLELGAE